MSSVVSARRAPVAVSSAMASSVAARGAPPAKGVVAASAGAGSGASPLDGDATHSSYVSRLRRLDSSVFSDVYELLGVLGEGGNSRVLSVKRRCDDKMVSARSEQNARDLILLHVGRAVWLCALRFYRSALWLLAHSMAMVLCGSC